VKKTRFLLLSSVVVLGGLLLSACGGQVVATGAPGLTVNGDRVYLASGSYVYSIDLATGQEATTTDDEGKAVPLRFPLQGRNNSFGSAPALVSEDQMVIGNAFSNDRKHLFFSFDPQNMQNSGAGWPYEGARDLWMGSPLVLDGTIYAPNSDGTLYAFDAEGNPQGTFGTGESIWAQPVTDGSTLYVASLDHNVYALDPGNLSQALWQTELDASIVSAVTLRDGGIYVGTINNSLYALDAASGEIQWHVTLDGGIWGTPAFAPQPPTEADGESQSGATDEAAATPGSTPTAEATPAPETATNEGDCTGGGETLYIGTETDAEGGTLYAIDAASGCTRWTVNTPASIAASPVVQGNTVFFVTQNGMIRAVSTEDGKQQWQEQLEGEFYTSPVVAGDLLLIAPAKGTQTLLAAYTLDGDPAWTYPVAD
jgi:outer membrane protein assembly factor BamB